MTRTEGWSVLQGLIGGRIMNIKDRLLTADPHDPVAIATLQGEARSYKILLGETARLIKALTVDTTQ